MKIRILDGKDRCDRDQWVPDLDVIQGNGINFLFTIVRLEDLLRGTLSIHAYCMLKILTDIILKNFKEVIM